VGVKFPSSNFGQRFTKICPFFVAGELGVKYLFSQNMGFLCMGSCVKKYVITVFLCYRRDLKFLTPRGDVFDWSDGYERATFIGQTTTPLSREIEMKNNLRRRLVTSRRARVKIK